MSQSFTFNTKIRVSAGDLIVVFQWVASSWYGVFTSAPTDSLGSSYTELSGADVYLGYTYDPPVVITVPTGVGGVYYAVASMSGTLSVTFNWKAKPGVVPGYAVYVLHGQKFNGNIYYPNSGGQTATGNSVSITTSGLPQTTYHFALLVAYVSNNPCTNALPSLVAQGFKQTLTWGDTCMQVDNKNIYLSDAFLYAYKYSAQDFTFNLQFTYAGTTIYGYAIVLV